MRTFTLALVLVAGAVACSGAETSVQTQGAASTTSARPATADSGAPPPEPAATAARASSSAAPPPPPPKPDPPCPDDMVDVGVACIDRFEAPNERGKKPLLMQSSQDAEAYCDKLGKRLCTEDEWLRACRGPQGRDYPYGKSYEESACNHDKTYRTPRWGALARWPAAAAKAEAARLDQSEPSGSRDSCVSAEGVYDLTGNVAEWVRKTQKHPEACLKPGDEDHSHVVQGCSWVKCFRPPHKPSCDYVNCAHAGKFRSYEMGFRCCQERRE